MLTLDASGKMVTVRESSVVPLGSPVTDKIDREPEDEAIDCAIEVCAPEGEAEDCVADDAAVLLPCCTVDALND